MAPDDPSVLKAIMKNFFTTGRYDSSAVYAERVYEIDSLPNAIYVLGFSAYEMGQSNRAVKYFEKYLEIGNDENKLKQVAEYLDRITRSQKDRN